MKNEKLKNDKRIIILGVGNILLGDEGVGPEAINFLNQKTFNKNITLLDGGTGGFHLLSEIVDFTHCIIIDAILDTNPEGTIQVTKPRYAKNFPPSLSAHELGLKDLIDAAILLDKLPNIYLIAVSIKNFQKLKIGLSEKIKQTLPVIRQHIMRVLSEIEAN